MQIVVLMGGVGERFSRAGYTKPKPLIRVDGKMMVEHVVDMYPGAHDLIFVCNESFADREEVLSLNRQYPNALFIPVSHHKGGPAHTLLCALKSLRRDDSVMVTYSDFSATWDFADFVRRIDTGNWDAAIPSYTGFHPHLLHRHKYAGIIADQHGRIVEIREKHCFTEDPERSYHSAGNYYFARAGELEEYARKLIESGETVNGEQYISMIYYHYLNEGKHVLVYPLTHFMQWGTPEDLEEYVAWSSLIQKTSKGATDIPEHRKELVRIPYDETTLEYERSKEYWKSFFSLVNNHT